MGKEDLLLKVLRRDVLLNLEGNILPYWMNRMVDPAGGFFGRRDGFDRLHPDAPRGAVLNSRILWTFSASWRLLRKKEYLDMAVRAKREVIDRFYDSEYGGIYWSIDPSGHPLDTKKQFYALGFAIYGLSEFARATGDEEAKEYAVRLFHDIEAHSRDRERGGYVEALTRDWQPIADVRLSGKDRNANKTMNTHLHIIEPYVNLLRVWNSPELREAIRGLLEVFADKIIRPERGWHLGLFFDDDWREIDPGTVSYGHDIEASWLLLEAATEHGDRALYEKYLDITGRVADAALEGVGADGAMIYERFPDGRIDGDYHWWVQAENVVGQLFLYLYHGRKDMAAAAFKSWNFIRKNLVDDNGEWFWSISEGKPSRSEDKAGFWKCPYHNSRMCLEILSRC